MSGLCDRSELSISGVDVRDWMLRHVVATEAHGTRFGSLDLIGASLEPLCTDRGRIDFAVLGPADPANSLEMAQVMIEQIALLPDAQLLAQSSLELRIVKR